MDGLAPIQWRKSEETGRLNWGEENNGNRTKKLYRRVQAGSGAADGKQREIGCPACPWPWGKRQQCVSWAWVVRPSPTASRQWQQAEYRRVRSGAETLAA